MTPEMLQTFCMLYQSSPEQMKNDLTVKSLWVQKKPEVIRVFDVL